MDETHTSYVSYAGVYLSALRANVRAIRGCVRGGAKLCVAVKADAYGHGAAAVSRALQDEGVDCLAVARVAEGAGLRDAGVTLPVLLLGLCGPGEVSDAVACGLTPLVFDRTCIALFDSAARSAGYGPGRRFPVHLAVDTGMGRIGCMPEDAAGLAKAVAGSGALSLGGMATHFSVSDSVLPDDRAYTRRQLDAFLYAADSVRGAGVSPGTLHCANSAAILDFPESHLDMVRCGISAYGYYPGDISAEYLARKGAAVRLEPCMSLCTRVAAVRDVRAGAEVSYGRTWRADRGTRIAVLPVGYADGVLRRFSPGLSVAINGKAYPVRGRICMDQCMVDVGSDDVPRWAEAVLFGPERSGALQTAEDIAAASGTISYEITCGISKRIPRVLLE